MADFVAPSSSSSSTMMERFQAERALVLQALDDKYRVEDEAHPENWVMHSAFDRGATPINHNETLARIVKHGNRLVLLALLTNMIEQGQSCFLSDAICVTRSTPVCWLIGSIQYVPTEDIFARVDLVYDDESLRTLVQAYVDEWREDLASLLIELVVQPVYDQWAAPAIAASPLLARFTQQLSDPETYFSLITQEDNEYKPQRFLLASPLAKVKTVLLPQDYDDYHTHVFSCITGRCFWVTLDRITLVPIFTAYFGEVQTL
jgi:hypothetical protein